MNLELISELLPQFFLVKNGRMMLEFAYETKPFFQLVWILNTLCPRRYVFWSIGVGIKETYHHRTKLKKRASYES